MQDLLRERWPTGPIWARRELQIANSQDRPGRRAQPHPAAGGPAGRHAEQRPGRGSKPAGAEFRTRPIAGGYGGALEQVLSRKYPTYGVGVQVTLPIHNRIAEADLARDELQTKQCEIRLRQLQNQARLEVEDALIAMRRARGSYEAAVQARKLQEESLRGRTGQVRSGSVHQLLRDPVREPAGAGEIHRGRGQELVREGPRRAGSAPRAPFSTRTTSRWTPRQKAAANARPG